MGRRMPMKGLRMSSVEIPDTNDKSSASPSPCPSPVSTSHLLIRSSSSIPRDVRKRGTAVKTGGRIGVGGNGCTFTRLDNRLADRNVRSNKISIPFSRICMFCVSVAQGVNMASPLPLSTTSPARTEASLILSSTACESDCLQRHFRRQDETLLLES